MATHITAENLASAPARPRTAKATAFNPFWLVLKGLSSLKLTLVLLALAIFLVFVGTLAQAKEGMWDAVSRYFTSWLVHVELQVFFPKNWFSKLHEYFAVDNARIVNLPVIGNMLLLQGFPYFYSFPFPGGATIGLAMIVNLMCAHLMRFKVRMSGLRLTAGVATLLAGIALTAVVIALGQFQQGVRAEPLLSWSASAGLILVGAAATAIGLGGGGVMLVRSALATGQKKFWLQAGLAIAGSLFSIVACILLVMFFNDISALRILWQLVQGTVAGAVLLAACWLLFDKRAGVVLLHGGVGLLMFGQLWVSLWAVEQRMNIVEGEKGVYAIDTRGAELAVIDATEDKEKTIVVPPSKLLAAVNATDAKAKRISDPELPFDLDIVAYYKNSELLTKPSADYVNLATKGIGLEAPLAERPVGAGASSDAAVDVPAAFIRVVDKQTGKDLGTYAASAQLGTADVLDRVRSGDKVYSLGLRFVRDYKPYHVLLKDITKEDYPGSSTPRKYESVVQFIDPGEKVDREVKVSMNNPFRYLGETFYQSEYRVVGPNKEGTTFQIVTNAGWMIPYIACMIVAVGMLFQFSQTLMGFVVTEAEQSSKLAAPISKRQAKIQGPATVPSWWGWFRPSYLAIVMIVVTLFVILNGARTPKPKAGEFDYYAFGKLPVLDGGRAKPLDSLARETLLALSNKITVTQLYAVDTDGKEKLIESQEQEEKAIKDGTTIKTRYLPAIQWLATLVARPDEAEVMRVIRIDNPDVVTALRLPSHEVRKEMRYSIAELRAVVAEFMKQLEPLRTKDKEHFTVYDNKIVELERRWRALMRVELAFTPISLPDLPHRDKIDAEKDPVSAQLIQRIASELERLRTELEQTKAPRAVLRVDNKKSNALLGDDTWATYSLAATATRLQQQLFVGEEVPVEPSVRSLNEIFAAYAKDEVKPFNEAVAGYTEWLGDRVLYRFNDKEFTAETVGLESYFNRFAPFSWSQGISLYFTALVISAVGLMGYRKSIGSAAFWMLVVVFALHTFGLIARIYISGRPPVTNLYSSAVFIGWSVVLMGLLLEAFIRLGVGNLIASFAGVATLIIADKLALGGDDTIGVMQAVLDTQFWLATHVVCITLGYSATFLAGLLGIAYIFRGVAVPTARNVGWLGVAIAALSFVLLGLSGFVYCKLLGQTQMGIFLVSLFGSIAAAIVICRLLAYTEFGLAAEDGKLLARMIYGVTCFALLLSFVGTVLGGLWADDSWGRFWGWDPKENGALIIVLWNAFILHAKWDKLANERGIAVLAVVGNIVTCWSWFGTNQLGVGLHSYGFTDGILQALGIAVLVHLVIIGFGLMPKSLWRSKSEEPALATAK